MNVKELIEHLSNLDQEIDIVIRSGVEGDDYSVLTPEMIQETNVMKRLNPAWYQGEFVDEHYFKSIGEDYPDDFTGEIKKVLFI